MNNLEIREFKQSIVNFINSSPVMDEVKRLVLSEILHEQNEKTTVVLTNEIRERDKKEAESNE